MRNGGVSVLLGAVAGLITTLFVPTTVDDYLMLWDFIGPYSMYSSDINYRKWGGQFGSGLAALFVFWIFRKDFSFVQKIPGFDNTMSYLQLLVSYILVVLGVFFSI